jgi:hypothetical protein
MTDSSSQHEDTPPDIQGSSPPTPSEANSFLANIRSWLETVISDQAQSDSTDFLATRTVFLYTERQNRLVKDASRIATELEEVKRRMVEEFGPSSSSFIGKCLDPMVTHLQTLISGLHVQKISGDTFEQFLQNAIECVQYYSGLDESKLKMKIVDDAHAMVHSAIQKDIEILLKYREEVLGEPSDTELDSVLLELRALMESSIQTDNLHDFFHWKTSVDEKRNGLVEMGLLIVDMMKEAKPTTGS